MQNQAKTKERLRKPCERPFFQPMRKSAKEYAELIDDGGVTGELKRDKTTVEKLNEFYTLTLKDEEFWEVPAATVFFAKDELEELSQIKESIEVILDQRGK